MKINNINIDTSFTGDPANVAKAVNYAIHGLLTDGGHHKQWALERVLESLGIDFKELRIILRTGVDENEWYEWEDGIAP